MHCRQRWTIPFCLLVLVLVACGRSTPVGQALPTVLLVTPADGQQVQVGDEVLIQLTATDTLGVSRVELGVDGVLLYSFENPSPEAGVPYTIEGTWTATTTGSHPVMAVAYNLEGTASSPAVVNLRVVSRPDSPIAPSPESPDVVPTATWTPLAIGPAGTAAPASTTEAAPTATEGSPREEGTGEEQASTPGLITDFEQFGTWERGDQANGVFAQSSEQVHSGSNAGKLAYDFPTSGNDFVVFLQNYDLEGQPGRISAWVYGDGSKHFMNAWIKDAAGETWQFSFGRVLHTGWQQMSAWLDTSAPWPAGHIDGLSDGVLDYPIAFRALVLDDAPDSYSGSGTIFVDDLYSEKANLPAPAAASSPAATSGGLSVSFRADETRIGAGSCTRLHWDVENAREVYLNGVGVVGHGEREVCPTGTTTYRLRVVRLDGAADVHRIMIEVVSP